MTTAGSSPTVWLLIVALGLGTFGMRLSFIQFYAYVTALPPAVERALRYIPAAILAALVFPALFPLGGPLVETVVNPHAVAGGVAALVAWRTGSMTWTIAVGMAVFWSLQFLVG